MTPTARKRGRPAPPRPEPVNPTPLALAPAQMAAGGYGTVPAVAEYLGVSVRTVRRWLAQRVLPRTKVGGGVRIAWAAVKVMLDRGTR